MAQIDWYKAIFDRLTADQSAGSFFADVGGRITIAAGAQDPPRPHCVITPVDDVADTFFEGDDLDANFQIDLWGDADASVPDDLIAINDKLIALLDKVSIPMDNHLGAEVSSTDRGIVTREDDSYRILSSWRVFATAT